MFRFPRHRGRRARPRPGAPTFRPDPAPQMWRRTELQRKPPGRESGCVVEDGAATGTQAHVSEAETSRNHPPLGGYSGSGARGAPLELSDLGPQTAREGMSQKRHSVKTAGIVHGPCVLAGPWWSAHSPSVTDESCPSSSHFDLLHHVASWASRLKARYPLPQPAAEAWNGAAHTRSAAVAHSCRDKHARLGPVDLSCNAPEWSEPPGAGVSLSA